MSFLYILAPGRRIDAAEHRAIAFQQLQDVVCCSQCMLILPNRHFDACLALSQELLFDKQFFVGS